MLSEWKIGFWNEKVVSEKLDVLFFNYVIKGKMKILIYLSICGFDIV